MEVINMTENNQNAVVLHDNNLNSLAANITVKDGKYRRTAKYENISTVTAETPDEQFRLASILVDGDGVTEFKNAIGTQFELVDVITEPYETVDELTGELVPGVTITLFAADGSVYATSSKIVYFKLMQLFKIFGLPRQRGFNIKLEIIQEDSKFSKNKNMNIKLVK